MIIMGESIRHEWVNPSCLSFPCSTMPQAIKIGQQMEAKFIMLTHFSQRYSYMPLLPEDLPDNVVIAFDYMKVQLQYVLHIYGIVTALD